MVQFVAFGGAMLFNQLAKWMGAKNAVVLSLVIWTGVVVAMYGFVHTTFEFWISSAIQRASQPCNKRWPSGTCRKRRIRR